MSEELKPCPFCGGTPQIHTQMSSRYQFVSCSRCRCDGPLKERAGDAISHWNRRASPRVEEVRRMREALEMFQTWWEQSLPRALIDAGFTGTIVGPKTQAMLDVVEAALTAYELHLKAKGLAVVPGWQPIESAPTDRLILVYCPSYQGLNAIVCCCQWHEDAGFCVDELRSPSHWRPLPAPPTNSPKEESDE